MREQKQIDHYMLFSNRRLAANAESEIVAYIPKPCGIPAASMYLCGLEQLEIWLKNFPEFPKLANLDLVDSPLIISPDDLSEVVQAFARQKDAIMDVLDDPPTARVSYEQKNAINNMTKDYAVALRKKYLKETPVAGELILKPIL